MAAGATFQLIVEQDGSSTAHSFRKDVVTIGRSQECDLYLADRLVSRLHCRVERLDDAFVLVDSGAANPTRLHGRQVVRTELKDGDTFQVGNCRVQLALGGPEVGSVDETRVGERPAAGDLDTFLRLSRALNDEQDLGHLLTQIVDAAIQLSGAERGFLILHVDGSPNIEVARNFAQEEVPTPEFKISRTIAQRVLANGVAELTTNAQEDDRFRDLQSVADLRLRSVLCLPIRGGGQVAGVLYVDNRLQQQVFREREKGLLMALAGQAGIAIAHARTRDALRHREHELQLAQRRIEQLGSALGGGKGTPGLDDPIAESGAFGRRSKHEYREICGQSRAVRAMLGLLDKFIDADDPVLITGESGTGKELVARAVHSYGKRSNRPFVSENCAALPAALLESELFGYQKGAFTGAHANKKGLLAAADGGVLFLDEVGEMPLDLQAKLLRVLQDGEVRPIGSRESFKVDLRLICATNRNLEEMVRDGDFREDLYYRISVLPVHVPPLRERRDDVPLLVRRFVADLAREGTHVRVGPTAMERLVQYGWPGNVRELQNEIRRAAVLCDGVILPEHLSPAVATGRAPALVGDSGLSPAERGTTLPDLVRELEVREIRTALQKAGTNKSRAAELLGLSRFALQRKLEKYGLEGHGHGDGAADAEAGDGGP